MGPDFVVLPRGRAKKRPTPWRRSSTAGRPRGPSGSHLRQPPPSWISSQWWDGAVPLPESHYTGGQSKCQSNLKKDSAGVHLLFIFGLPDPRRPADTVYRTFRSAHGGANVDTARSSGVQPGLISARRYLVRPEPSTHRADWSRPEPQAGCRSAIDRARERAHQITCQAQRIPDRAASGRRLITQVRVIARRSV